MKKLNHFCVLLFMWFAECRHRYDFDHIQMNFVCLLLYNNCFEYLSIKSSFIVRIVNLGDDNTFLIRKNCKFIISGFCTVILKDYFDR